LATLIGKKVLATKPLQKSKCQMEKTGWKGYDSRFDS